MAEEMKLSINAYSSLKQILVGCEFRYGESVKDHQRAERLLNFLLSMQNDITNEQSRAIQIALAEMDAEDAKREVERRMSKLEDFGTRNVERFSG